MDIRVAEGQKVILPNLENVENILKNCCRIWTETLHINPIQL